MAFDPEMFVAECQTAAAEVDAVGAVRDVVAAAIADGSSIDAALGTEFKREADTLFSSTDLTVQRILWPPGIAVAPHDHRMWAVVGVYAGEELNRIFERSLDGLTESGGRVVAPRDVFVLDTDAIHSVENPLRGWTAGLHVYGGDSLGVERSAWGPDGREVPWSQSIARTIFQPMFQAMYDLASDHGKDIDDEARYAANRGLIASWERERRYPTPAEARRIIADAWQVPA